MVFYLNSSLESSGVNSGIYLRIEAHVNWKSIWLCVLRTAPILSSAGLKASSSRPLSKVDYFILYLHNAFPKPKEQCAGSLSGLAWHSLLEHSEAKVSAWASDPVAQENTQVCSATVRAQGCSSSCGEWSCHSKYSRYRFHSCTV